MVTLVWRTDVHVSDGGPTKRMDDWMEALEDNLKQVAEVARETGALAVLDGGDYFDIKAPTKNSHALVRRTAELHREHYPCPVYACVGNHDCVHSDIANLPRQPLGVLFATKVFERLYDEHEAVFEKGGVKVRVVGVPYHGVRYDKTRFTSVVKGDEDYLILVAHVLASRKKGSMFDGEDILSYEFLAELDADVVCLGHWHKNQGIEELAEGRYVVNTGSLSRGSISQDNLTRCPSCVVMTFTTHGILLEERGLEVPPAEEVFAEALEDRARDQLRVLLAESFVESIKAQLGATKQQSLRERIQAIEDIPSNVREGALFYVEKAEP